MGRRSFFFKNYVMHLLLIVCAFAVAGGVFYYQMSNYALASKQAELRTTVQSLAEQTKLMQGTDSDIIREIYMLSIGRVAKEDAITVCVTDADGVIQMVADPSGSVRPTARATPWVRACRTTAGRSARWCSSTRRTPQRQAWCAIRRRRWCSS